MKLTDLSSILVIRRDNIGDLVCTTPMLTALRQAYPQARIAALVNSYNQEVLHANTDVDQVYAYTKSKHRRPGESRLRAWVKQAWLYLNLRRERFDLVIVAGSSYSPRTIQLASWLAPRHIIAYGASNTLPSPSEKLISVYRESNDHLHEVEAVFHLLRPLGITGLPGPMHVFPDLAARSRFQNYLGKIKGDGKLVGFHLSSRRPDQRWPADKFFALIRSMHQTHGISCLLFWAPGEEGDPMHPGDDNKAAQLIARLDRAAIPVQACSTHTLRELIAGLSLCDQLILSDGGALHLAAALGKPLVCLFGDVNPEHWHPWGVPYKLLQPDTRRVADLQPDMVQQAWEDLNALP
ncbi:MAG: glycosyltransferase family 9 protein [Pseudomonadales bacterium]|nr:glycosyltransferase family 9 protein [Pseudomonadales bacterium]